MGQDINAKVAEAVGDKGSPYWMLSDDGGKSYRDICNEQWELPEFKKYYDERMRQDYFNGCEIVEAVRHKDYAGDLNLAWKAAEKFLAQFAKEKQDYAEQCPEIRLMSRLRLGSWEYFCEFSIDGMPTEQVAAETPALAICHAILEARGK